MKKTIFLISVLTLCACSNDDQETTTQTVIDNTKLVGEWVSITSSASYFTDLVLSSNYSAEYSVFNNDYGISAIDTDKGVWSWLNDINGLSINTKYRSFPVYQVMELNDDSVKMRNLGYNVIDTYYRVVETVEVNSGGFAPITYLSEHTDCPIDQIMCLNDSVAAVTAEGMVEGRMGGITYVRLLSGQALKYVKVIVTSRMDRFAKQTHMLIGKVIEQNGDLNYTIKEVSSDGNSGESSPKSYQLEYKEPTFDPHLRYIVYYFDLYTGEIDNIYTEYRSTEWYYMDLLYLKRFYHSIRTYLEDIDWPIVWLKFGEKEYSYDNEYVIVASDYKDLGYYTMTYYNQDISDLE